MEETHAGAVCEELPLEEFVGDCSHVRDPMLEPRKSLRGLKEFEEGVAETKSEELTTAPIPCPPMLPGGKEVEKIMRKLSLGRTKE